MPHPKFDWTISLGDALKLFSLAVGLVVAWSNLNSAVNALDRRVSSIEDLVRVTQNLTQVTTQHETRLKAIEDSMISGRAERLTFQNRVMEVLTTVREDLGYLKATVHPNSSFSAPSK